MDNKCSIKLYAFTVDCKNPDKLANFYARLLGWEVMFGNEEYTLIGPPGSDQGSYPCITFQKNPAYLPPVWPAEPQEQQQMAHLDFAVNDLEKAVNHAVQCGATIAEKQFSDGWRVMLDPAGHPFCLCFMGHIFETPSFGLL